MNTAIIGAVVRWCVTIGASHHLFTGLDQSQIQQGIDAVLLLITLGWSVWLKRHER